MGGESSGRSCEEIKEDQGSYRGSGTGSVLSGTTQQVCHHPQESGWQVTGTNISRFLTDRTMTDKLMYIPTKLPLKITI